MLVALAVQTGGALMWAGAAAERLSTLERQALLDRPVAERLARVEARLAAVQDQLDRIEDRLEKVDA